MLHRYFHVFANYRYAFLLTGLIGIALVLPSLASGFFADDFTHAALIREGSLVKQPDNLSLFHLFSFVDTNPERRLQLFGFSITPWWISNDFSLIFFRPFSELTHYVDYQWLTPHASLMHLHSIIWYGFLLYLLARFYKIFCPSYKVALLAFVLFAVDSTHGFTVAWLANRNALLAAVFTLLAVINHHRFRESRQVRYLIFSVSCIITSFLATEAGIVAGVFLFAYALFIDKDGSIKGLLYLLPAFLVFLAWFAIYKSYGYGAFGNRAYYIDPVQSPALFLHNLPERLSRTLAMQFNLVPIHLIKPFKVFMIVSGLVIFSLLAISLSINKSPRYRFFLCSMILAIIPISSGELQDRNMLFVGIAACPILAEFIRYLNRQQHVLTRIAAGLILFFHILVSGALMLPLSYAPKVLAYNSIATARSLPDSIATQYIISFGVPFFDVGYLATIRRNENLVLPQQLWNVTTQINGLEVERLSGHEFVINNPKGLLADIDFMLRDMSFDPVQVKEQFDMNGLVLTVEQLNQEGVPIKASLKVRPDIAVNDIALFYRQGSSLKPFTLPTGQQRSFK